MLSSLNYCLGVDQSPSLHILGERYCAENMNTMGRRDLGRVLSREARREDPMR